MGQCVRIWRGSVDMCAVQRQCGHMLCCQMCQSVVMINKGVDNKALHTSTMAAATTRSMPHFSNKIHVHLRCIQETGNARWWKTVWLQRFCAKTAELKVWTTRCCTPRPQQRREVISDGECAAFSLRSPLLSLSREGLIMPHSDMPSDECCTCTIWARPPWLAYSRELLLTL